MAQPKFLGNVKAVADGQYAAGSAYLLADDDHGTVVQRRVLEEDVLYEPLINQGIDALASSHDVVEWCGALNDYQGAHFLFAHAHARHDDGHDELFQLFFVVLFVAIGEQPSQHLHALMGAEVIKELADVLLEEDYQSDDTNGNQLVHDAAQQFHL